MIADLLTRQRFIFGGVRRGSRSNGYGRGAVDAEIVGSTPIDPVGERAVMAPALS